MAHFLNEDSVEDTLPRGHLGQLGAVLVDVVPRELATASIEINLVNGEPAGALPDEAADPEDDDDGKGQVGLEEALGRVDIGTNGGNGNVELQNMISHNFQR